MRITNTQMTLSFPMEGSLLIQSISIQIQKAKSANPVMMKKIKKLPKSSIIYLSLRQLLGAFPKDLALGVAKRSY